MYLDPTPIRNPNQTTPTPTIEPRIPAPNHYPWALPQIPTPNPDPKLLLPLLPPNPSTEFRPPIYKSQSTNKGLLIPNFETITRSHTPKRMDYKYLNIFYKF